MKIRTSALGRRIRHLLLAVAASVAATPAFAHEVWIEDTPDGQLVVRFAEYGEKFEKSPGALDALSLPFAWTPTASKPEEPKEKSAESPAAREARAIQAGQVAAFDVQKKSDGFILTGSTASQPAQIETGFTVMGKAGDPEKPARKPYFYARWQPVGAGAAQPALNFDLVPTGASGKVCLYFRGKPLPGFKVNLYPPAEAEQELVTDAAGMVQFSATKPGLYLLTAAHQRETIAGFFGGKPYDAISHNCSLSWRQP
ncbi:MAG: hypothetical protein WDN28_34025 [Chthoniobacter sp.]